MIYAEYLLLDRFDGIESEIFAKLDGLVSLPAEINMYIVEADSI